MTLWSQLGSDPLPLSFWKLPQKCYAGDKSFNCESGTTTENDNLTVLRKTYDIGLQ